MLIVPVPAAAVAAADVVQVEMWSACQSLVFGSAGQVLFGRAFFNRHGLAHLQETFLSFEENFEVWIWLALSIERCCIQ